MTTTTEVTITYINIVLYALSYQLQRPIEPFLVRSLVNAQTSEDEDSSINQTYGRLTSFFSLIQTIGSPLIGTLLDTVGIRPTSILVYTGSAASYAILSQSKTPAGLYWSKLPALLQHAFLVGQATVVSCEESSVGRAAALGRMTTAYTVGATIGPALGGYLGEKDLYAGARLAVWGSIISIVLSAIYLKNRVKDHRQKGGIRRSICATQNNKCIQSVTRTVSYLQHPIVGPLLFIKLLNGVSSSAFSTILPLILANNLNFTTAELGYYMSANSFSVAVFACVGIGPSLKVVGDRADRLAFWGIAIRAISFVFFGIVVTQILFSMKKDATNEIAISNSSLVTTTLASIAVSLASHAHATSLTTLTTGSVTSDERGAILGLEHGLFSMARVAGPPLGTTLLSLKGPSFFRLKSIGMWIVISVCVLLDILLLVLIKVWSRRQHNRTVEELEVNEQASKSLMSEHDHDHSD